MATTYTLISSNTLSSSAASVTESDFTEADIQFYLDKKIVNENGCWVLPTNRNPKGYTYFHKKGLKRMAHRVLWVATNGSIGNMDVDYMCHNEAAAKGECAGGTSCKHRACFNPEHLRLATRSENLSASSKGFFLKETCPNGHSREAHNVRYEKNGKPFCWVCRKNQVKLYKRRKKAEAK